MPEKILVVDDNEAMLHAVSRLMKHAGYEVCKASTGKECLELATKVHPDLILLDVQLPDISGIEVLNRIKADEAVRDIFVVHLSAEKIHSHDQATALEMGADGYISQPIDNIELIARVRAFLRHKKTMDELRASEARYRHLFESNPQPMWIVDRRETRFLAINDSAVKHYGYSREEFFRLRPKELIFKSRMEDDAIPPLSPFDLQQQHRKKDGSILDVEISQHTVRWKETDAIAMLVADVTAWKRVERERKQLLEQYKREIQTLQQISTPRLRPDSASQPLQELTPHVFAGLQEKYEKLLELALEQRIYKVNNKISPGLRTVASRLFALRASPRDVIDLHCIALKNLAPEPEHPKFQGYVEIGRLTIVELMGYVVSAYREFTIAELAKS